MAKLSRFTAKIFGSTAGTDQVGVFGSLFAGSAVTTTDPNTAQSLSNWLTGWFGAAIGGNAPAIEDMNSAFFVHSYQIAKILQAGITEWDAGTAYFIGSFATDATGGIFFSLTDNNTGNALSDTSKWKIYSTDVTATGKDFFGSSLPSGYIWASGKTIGSASSGATERANADTLDLYTIFWNNYSNTLLPIFDSAGVVSTRGANAAADFAANKRLTVIDKRGRVSVGKDDLGGSAAGRVTSATMAPDGITLGASGGEQTHSLTGAELAAHDHGVHITTGVNNTDHTHGVAVNATNGGAGTAAIYSSASAATNTGTTQGQSNTHTHDISGTTDTVGSSTGHNTMQPSILCNYIIKL